MKYTFTKKLLLVASCFLVFSACQDNPASEIDQADEDMITAVDLANTVVDSDEARRACRRSATVIKYNNGKLVFATNTDDVRGYQEIDEQTITANLEPGEQHFWYAGSGVTDLVAIELDSASQSSISCLPEEVLPGQLWRIAIPENISSEILLKYDIVYQFRGNTGAPVRLDPKLKVEN